MEVGALDAPYRLMLDQAHQLRRLATGGTGLASGACGTGLASGVCGTGLASGTGGETETVCYRLGWACRRLLGVGMAVVASGTKPRLAAAPERTTTRRVFMFEVFRTRM